MDGPPDSRTLGGPAWMPSADVTEADDKLVVTVEVPGLERDDLDLGITPEGLIIRGEKREEREDTRKDYRLLERGTAASSGPCHCLRGLPSTGRRRASNAAC